MNQNGAFTSLGLNPPTINHTGPSTSHYTEFCSPARPAMCPERQTASASLSMVRTESRLQVDLYHSHMTASSACRVVGFCLHFKISFQAAISWNARPRLTASSSLALLLPGSTPLGSQSATGPSDLQTARCRAGLSEPLLTIPPPDCREGWADFRAWEGATATTTLTAAGSRRCLAASEWAQFQPEAGL